jgi:hypothetical protein
MQNWETYQAKSTIFDLFEYTRILFNDYCNGFNNNYEEEDKERIKKILELIEKDTKEIKEWI